MLNILWRQNGASVVLKCYVSVLIYSRIFNEVIPSVIFYVNSETRQLHHYYKGDQISFFKIPPL